MIKAIVVGISKYPGLKTGLLQNSDVPGAVEDALSFRDWLVQDRKLTAAEISLHLSPAEGHPEAKSAARAALRTAIRELRRSAPDGGDRFFFFSGHGFSFQQNLNGALEDVIACADFETPADMDPTILTGDILEYLLRMGRLDQYFFFDCCRNSIAAARLSGGALGLNEAPDPTLSDSSQFALFAARPGETTAAPSPFTQAVLSGLRGTGSARVWSGKSLVVTFDSLRQYVQKRLVVGPMFVAKGSSEGIVLKVYTPGPGAVPPRESCDIQVAKVKPSDRLVAQAFLDGDAIAAPVDLPGGKGTLRLTPRTYTVTLESPEGVYEVEPPSALVDFLEPVKVEAEATRLPVLPIHEQPFFHFEPGISKHVRRTDAVFEVQPKGNQDKLHSVRLVARVPVGASAEVIEANGERRREVVAGPDPLDFKLPPGKYTVRLSQAGRTVREVPVALLPGQGARIDLSPPPSDPVRSGLAACTGGTQFMPSESLGPIVDPRLSLQLAAVAVKAASGRPHMPFANPPVPPPGAAFGSLFVLVATGTLPRARLWISASSQEIPLVPSFGVPGCHHGVAQAPLGTHVLGWESAAGQFSMAIPVLANRVTTVVITDSSGEPRSAELFLVAHRATEDAIPVEERPTASQVLAARSLVNCQESHARGTQPWPFEGAWLDPLWTLLDACGALRERDLDRARQRVALLCARWPALSDVPVLKRLLGQGDAPITEIPLVADDARALVRWHQSAAQTTTEGLGAEGSERPGAASPVSAELAGRLHLSSLQRTLPGTVWTTWAGWPDTAVRSQR